MPFNILDIMNSVSLEKAGESKGYEEITLNYKDIIVTKHNKYSMNELEEMATGIEIDGLQQPLVLGRVNGEWWLVSGHRRYAGINILINAGKTEFEYIKCRYKDMTETEFRIALLVGNTFNRKMTDYDLMHQAREWKEVLTQAKKEGLIMLDKGENIRKYVASILGESNGKIGTLEAINNNAVPEVKAEFEKGTMGITAAYNASQLSQQEQVELAQKAASGQDMKCEEIKAQAEEKKSHREQEAKAQSMSDTDTTEEEKENTRKLHAVKMLEKYYIYISDYEVELLERMLEDCKRRKREYALDEGQEG